MGSQPSTDGGLPVLASLTKYIPHPGVAHAGGQYAQHHYDALGEWMAVREIAPDTRLNRAAVQTLGDVSDVSLMPGIGLFRSGRFKALSDAESAWAGSSTTRNIRTAFARGHAPWELLSDADIIEFQWSEMTALAPRVREQLPRTPLVGIAHDVITQRWDRAAEAASWPMSAAYRLAAARSGPRERRSFEALDAVIAFSDKDAALIAELAPGARAEVVLPGLGPAPGVRFARDPDPAEPIVLFTGALGRADNHDAAMWFLERVWPVVVNAVPTARFIAAGAGPRPALQHLLQRSPRATATGFVESLEPFYARASVFVAPIFTGAGVKFKTIDAILRSVPLVATPVAVEGIPAPELEGTVSADPEVFAAAVVAALRTPDLARTDRLAGWADTRYGRSAFSARLRSVYGGLLPGG